MPVSRPDMSRRRSWLAGWRDALADVGHDLRFATRTLLKNPGFSAAAVLSLAIGIGANTTIFSVVDPLLIEPLPYRDASRLVILWNRSPGLGITEDWFSTAQYFDIRNGHTGFEQVAIAIGSNLNLTEAGEAERVGVIRMSSSLLPMLGVQPALGRLLLPEEDVPGRAGTALLGHGLWSRRFGSDPGVVGRTIALNGQPFQVVGVLPRSFSLPREVLPTLGGAADAEIVVPLPLPPAAPTVRDREDYNILGKLRPGVSVAQAQSEMDAITARLRRDHPDLYPPNGGLTFSVVPLRDQVVGDVRRPLYVLIGAVGLVLLVACANVANLMLARAVAREREIAVRTALGAGRGRVLRQLLTESVLVALAGGGLGIVLTVWSLSWIRVLGAKSVPRLPAIAIDWRVLGFTVLVSVATGLLFGLLPALRASRVDLHSTLKAGGREAGRTIWGRDHGLRGLLVVAELALSVMLLVGAGLLVRSFARLQNVEPGFRAERTLTFELTMTGRQYNSRDVVLASYRELWGRMDRLPGVLASGGTSALPLTQTLAWTSITIEGRVPPPGEKFINADERVVAWRYFDAMQIPVRAGRAFDDRDAPTSAPVVIVDERLARQFWPNQDPIGKRLKRGGADSRSPWLTVVGVVGRVKHEGLDSDPRITFYLPHTQFPTRTLTLVLRTASDPLPLDAAARKQLREFDPGLPMFRVATMDRVVRESLARRRFTMVLLGVFSGLALALAAVGIYGVMAYLVSQGARDMGIRIALGATRGVVIGLVLRQGMALASCGVAAGLVGAWALSRWMATLLFEVSTTDIVTFSVVPALLVAVAALACYVPARRAAGVDPLVALRCE